MHAVPEPSRMRPSGKGTHWRRGLFIALSLSLLALGYRHFTRPVLPLVHGRPLADVILDACDGKGDRGVILNHFSAISAPLLGDVLVADEPLSSRVRRYLEPHLSARFLQYLPPLVDTEARWRNASSLLADLGTNAVKARPQLVLALEKNRQEDVQVHSTIALANLDCPIPEAVTSLIRLANATNTFVLLNTWPRLSRLGVPAEAVLPVLRSGLSHPDSGVRFAALAALFQYGTNALPALEPVIDLAQSDDPNVSSMAIQALGAMGSTDPRVIQALASALQGTDLHHQILALNALGRLGPGAAPAVPRIVDAMRNNVGGLWRFGRAALLNIAPNTPEARQELHEQ